MTNSAASKKIAISRAARWAGSLAAACGTLLAGAASAETGEAAAEHGAASHAQPQDGPRIVESLPVGLDTIRTLQVTTRGEVLTDETNPVGWSGAFAGPFANPNPPAGAGHAAHASMGHSSMVPGAETRGNDCFYADSHSNPPFNGGSFNAQAGFAENEWAIQTFTIPADRFPLRIGEMQILFVTSNAVVQTTTEWSVAVWEGTPDTGTPVAVFSSDDVILPHLSMGPGNNGTVIAVSVDPNDPDQIFVSNDGSNTFSFGFRVDRHNNQTGSGCGFGDIPSNRNAFPATDTDGLSSPGGNWLGAINCGILGCPPGFNPFSTLGLCTPSGDWAMSVTYESLVCAPATGACCDPATGGCSIQSADSCATLGGNYQGDDTTCAGAMCPLPTVACCFESTGGCLDLDADTCVSLNGQPGEAGSSCATTVCFPTGSCCLPDGGCADGVSPEECMMMNGVFQGDGSTCASTNCPEPTGACCVGDNCAPLTEGDCAVVQGSWAGPGSTCADDDDDGVADDCQGGCPADWDDDGDVDIFDILAFLNTWNAQEPGSDYDNDMNVNIFDILAFLGDFNTPCP